MMLDTPRSIKGDPKQPEYVKLVKLKDMLVIVRIFIKKLVLKGVYKKTNPPKI